MVRLLPIGLAVVIIGAGTAHAAGSESVAERVEALTEALAAQQAQIAEQQRKLEEQAAELARLQAAIASQQVQAADKQVAELKQSVDQAKIATRDAPKVSMVSGRPTITTADGRSSLAIRGISQLDAAHYSQDPPGPLTTDFRRGSVGSTGNRETTAAQDLSDGVYFRRARIGVEGIFNRDFGYRLVAEFGGSGTEAQGRINDAYVNYTGLAPFTVQLGAFSPPANLEDSVPVDDLLFTERSTPSELSRALAGADGRIGLGIRGSGARWMSSLTFTSRTVADPEVLDSQFAAVGRFGFLAATSADYNVHVGVNGTYVFQPPDQGIATTPRYASRFRDRPEIRVDSTRLIDTGSIDADSVYSAGLEFGANWKNWFLQAEDFRYGIRRREPTTLDDPSFSAWYAQASWVLTGESHRYNVANGSFAAPRPFVPVTMNGGPGAWELALRYSHTDLDHNEGAAGTACLPGCIRGGVQNIWSFGVNWYINPNVRFLFDYMHVDVDRLNPAGPGNTAPFGPPPATPPIGVQIGQDLDIYALRSQFNF